MRKEASMTSMSSKNLVQLLVERAANPSRVGASTKGSGQWKDSSWGELLEQVKHLSAGLIALGVKPGDRVAIFAATDLPWVVSDLAIAAAQAITVPIYPSNTSDECRYILNDSESVLVLVDNDQADGKQVGRLSRMRAKLGECPSVKRLVVFNGPVQGEQETSLADAMSRGALLHRENPAGFDARAQAVKATDPACFIYTSGTTGEPKGVILTHGNWAYEAAAVAQIGLMAPEDAVMLFLPLAHSFAQVIKAAWLGMGFKLIFAESTDKLIANLAETKPTILPAVPRVYEKVFNNVVSNGTSAPGIKGKLARWAFREFDAYAEARAQGRPYKSLGWGLAQRLVFSKVKATLSEKLGGRMRIFVSGGAPLSEKIAYFFDLIGLQVLEGYGLTETSAATTVNPPGRARIGTVGPAVPGTELKIAEDGEILIRGPGVMKGYYKNPAATAEVLEPNGWFHSGDIGELDAQGCLKITDRKKDIIVTAGGKNVSPQNLENLLKTHPIVSQAMVHGDKRKYLSVLICVNEDNARKLAAARGEASATYADVVRSAAVKEAVQVAINEVNSNQPPFNTLKRFHLMEHEFTVDSGDLTPTLKVKRKHCTQLYRKQLDGMYDTEAAL